LSKEWIKARKNDPYYRKAKTEGYRSRAAYKLKEIAERLSLFRNGNRVLDIGASPGGWSQVAAEAVGTAGLVVAVDIEHMDPVRGVTFIQGDVTDPIVQERIASVCHSFDCVISDASPRLSGNKVLDRGRDLALCWAVLESALRFLRKDGTAIVKVFQGDELIELRQYFQPYFRSVDTIKPRSSTNRSSEVYLAFRHLQAGGSQQPGHTEEGSGISSPQ